jgi:hypothetical protein
MIGLLDNRLVPLTDTIGFLRCPVEVAAAAFLTWQRPIQDRRGVRLAERKVSGPFEGLLRELLPLTSVERRRFLFVPTNSDWTAFVDNGHQGTDAFSQISHLALAIGCAGIRATDAGPGATQGGTVFEAYGPEATDGLNTERAIYAAPNDGRWSFGMCRHRGRVSFIEMAMAIFGPETGMATMEELGKCMTELGANVWAPMTKISIRSENETYSVSILDQRCEN